MRAMLGDLTSGRTFWHPRHFSSVRSTAQGDAGRLCQVVGSEGRVDQGQMAAGGAGEAGTRALQPPLNEPAPLCSCTPTRKVSRQGKKKKRQQEAPQRDHARHCLGASGQDRTWAAGASCCSKQRSHCRWHQQGDALGGSCLALMPCRTRNVPCTRCLLLHVGRTGSVLSTAHPVPTYLESCLCPACPGLWGATTTTTGLKSSKSVTFNPNLDTSVLPFGSSWLQS